MVLFLIQIIYINIIIIPMCLVGTRSFVIESPVGVYVTTLLRYPQLSAFLLSASPH